MWTKALEVFHGYPFGAFLDDELEKAGKVQPDFQWHLLIVLAMATMEGNSLPKSFRLIRTCTERCIRLTGFWAVISYKLLVCRSSIGCCVNIWMCAIRMHVHLFAQGEPQDSTANGSIGNYGRFTSGISYWNWCQSIMDQLLCIERITRLHGMEYQLQNIYL